MVTISGMSASQAGSYFEKDMNYFDKDGGEGGTWVGKGAESLGLKEGSVVKDEVFKSLASGMDTEGNRLTKDGNEGDIDRAGLNITYSVDKSVSIMAMADPRIGEMVKESAINSFKDVAEKYMVETRVTTDGMRENEATGNLTGAAFLHETSRVSQSGDAPDPQLHVHIFAMNMTKDSNGDWKSLSNEKFYEFQRAMGQDFQNRIAQGLEKLGYGVESVKSGDNFASGVKGISQELKDEFSNRHQDIHERISQKEAELGRSLTGAERQNVVNDTRGTKAESTLPIEQIKGSWDERLEAKGLTKESLKEMTANQVSDKAVEANTDKVIDKAVETVSDKQSVFSNMQVAGEALKANTSLTFDKAMENINSKMEQYKGALENKNDMLGLQQDKTHEVKMTSKSVIDAENNIVSKVEQGNSKDFQAMSKDEFKEITQDRQFFTQKFDQDKFEQKRFDEIGGTEGQKASAEHILTSKEQFVGIQGVAGAGKTAMLNEVSKIADNMDLKINIIVLTPTGKASDEAMKATDGRVTAMTVDKFLVDKKFEPGEGKNIFVLDEGSMVGTKKLSDTMDKIENMGGKMVIMGDKFQHKAVNQGDMFTKLQDMKQMNFSQMNQSVRQQSELTKNVIKSWENGNQKEALTILKDNGKLHEGTVIKDEYGKESVDMTKVNEKLVENVAKDYKEVGLMKTAVVVRTNAEKDNFNDTLRGIAQEQGQVSRDGQQFTTLVADNKEGFNKESVLSYKEGGVIAPDKRTDGIKAGTMGRITSINSENNSMKIDFQGKEITVSGEKLQNFTSYREVEKEFAQGDKIVFTKNSGDIKNGGQARIEEFDGSNINVRLENGDKVTIDADKYKHLDHAYAVTSHKAQGGSFERTHLYATADKMQNQNAGYVGLTRAVKEITAYTDSKEKLNERYQIQHTKENAMDYDKKANFSKSGFTSTDKKIEKHDPKKYESEEKKAKTKGKSTSKKGSRGKAKGGNSKGAKGSEKGAKSEIKDKASNNKDTTKTAEKPSSVKSTKTGTGDAGGKDKADLGKVSDAISKIKEDFAKLEREGKLEIDKVRSELKAAKEAKADETTEAKDKSIKSKDESQKTDETKSEKDEDVSKEKSEDSTAAKEERENENTMEKERSMSDERDNESDKKDDK